MHKQIKFEPDINIIDDRIAKNYIDVADDDEDRPAIVDTIDIANDDFGKGKTSFFCKICGKEFLIEEAIRFHIQVYHYNSMSKTNILAFAVPLETLEAETDSNFERKGQQFLCNICGKKFLTKLSIQMHLRVHSFKEQQPTSVLALDPLKQEPSDDVVVVMEKDAKLYDRTESITTVSSFDDTTNMKIKMEMKLTKEKQVIKPYKCHLCDKQFVYKKSMEHHIFLHQSKSLKCNICSKQFARENAFTQHVQSHLDETKTYKCVECPLVYERQTNLNAHILLVHSKFNCDICRTQFNDKNALRTHMIEHSNEILFACELCDEKCRNLNELRKHMVRQHNVDKTYC